MPVGQLRVRPSAAVQRRFKAAVFDLAKYLGYDRDMKRVKIGEFRDRASELIRRAAGGETIVILHRDREVAKVVPIRSDKDGERLVGCLARTAEVHGDIDTPIAPPAAWFRHSK